MTQDGPYPAIDQWVIPADALSATLRGVGQAGQRGVESGALWLGRRGLRSIVSAVVLPRGDGVIELPQRWQVSPEVYGVVSRWASPRSLVLLAMVHIHGEDDVGMSWSDRNRVVQVPGMLSIILGNGGTDSDHNDWGWYVYDDGAYRPLSESERLERIEITTSSHATVWVADDATVTEGAPE